MCLFIHNTTLASNETSSENKATPLNSSSFILHPSSFPFMPISGPSSYVPTTQLFIAHWLDVDAALTPDLVLSNGMAQGDFSDARDVLLDRRGELETADLELELARATLEEKKAWLHERIVALNVAVRGAMTLSIYARVLAEVPGIGDGQERFSSPMTKTAQLWAKINTNPPAGFTAPLLLPDGTTAAQFTTAADALRQFYDDVLNRQQDVDLALEKRNDVQDQLYEGMKLYRLAVPGRLPAGSALVDSLPALTPDSSRTPDPVELTGTFNSQTNQATLTAAVSTDPDLEEYELRYCTGANYSTENEHFAATIPQGTPPVFVTNKGLQSPGLTASFKVYVRLNDGGEAGSNAVVLQRPV
jgi:hypothetical protein